MLSSKHDLKSCVAEYEELYKDLVKPGLKGLIAWFAVTKINFMVMMGYIYEKGSNDALSTDTERDIILVP